MGFGGRNLKGGTTDDFLENEMMKETGKKHMMAFKKLENELSKRAEIDRNLKDAYFLDAFFNDDNSVNEERNRMI